MKAGLSVTAGERGSLRVGGGGDCFAPAGLAMTKEKVRGSQ